MKKLRVLLEILSITILTVPNLIYLLCNTRVLKEANYVAITMIALVVLAVICLGAFIHCKIKAGIWILLIGVFIVSVSNISLFGGIALIIEGLGLAVDGYFIKPLVIKLKVKELESNGRKGRYTQPYTRNIE